MVRGGELAKDVVAVAVHRARERLKDGALAPFAHPILAKRLKHVLVADGGVARDFLGRETTPWSKVKPSK